MIGTFIDHRGEIKDLIQFDAQEIAITRIRSFSGVVRGNHYHKETTQWTYIVKGITRVVSISPVTDILYEKIVGTGDVVLHLPNEKHAFEALEDTEWIVVTKGPRKGDNYESDTFRLEVPLI